MSGEVYAAAKASTCCDAAGEESPKGRRGSNIPLETNSIFGACLSTTPPSEDKGFDAVIRQIASSET